MSDINLNNYKKPTNHITYEMENFFDYQGYSKKIKEFIKEKNQDLIPSFNNDKQLENDYHFVKKEDNIYSPHLKNFNQGKFNSIYNIDLNKNLFGYDKTETNYDENYNRYYKEFYGELNVTDPNQDNYYNKDNINNNININNENLDFKSNNNNFLSQNNIPGKNEFNEFKQSKNIINNDSNNPNYNFDQNKLYNNLNIQNNIPNNNLDYQNSNNNSMNYNPKYTQSQQLEAEYNKMNYTNNSLNNDNIIKNSRFNDNNIPNNNINTINSSQGYYPSYQQDNIVNQNNNNKQLNNNLNLNQNQLNPFLMNNNMNEPFFNNNNNYSQNQPTDNSNLTNQPFNNNNMEHQKQLDKLFDNNNSYNINNKNNISQSQFESTNKNDTNANYNNGDNQVSNINNNLNPNQINMNNQFKDNNNQNLEIFNSENLNNMNDNNNYKNLIRNQNQNNLNQFDNNNLNNIPNNLNQSSNIQNNINELNKNINNLNQSNDINNSQNKLNQSQDSKNRINLNQIPNQLNQPTNKNLEKIQIPNLSLPKNNIEQRKSFINSNKSNEENPLNKNIPENNITGDNLTNLTFTNLTTTNPLLTTTSIKGLKRRSVLDTDENRKLLSNPDEDGFSEMKVSNPFTRPDNHYVQKEKEYNARKGIKEKNLFEDETEDSQESNLNNNIDYDIDSIMNKPLILKSQKQNNLDNNKENINDINNNNNNNDNLNENDENKELEKKKKLKQFKSIHTIKIGKIQHLPLEQQILILYNENKQLTNELDRYKKLFGDIDALEGVEGIANEFKNLLMQENENLRNLNKEGEKIINEFIKFINSINEKLDRNKINIDDIRQNANNLAKFFSPLKHEIIGHINRSLKRKRKDSLMSGVSFDSKENLSDDEDYSKRIIEKLRKLNQNGFVGPEGNYMLNYYDDEHHTWIRNCLPCQLGYNQSSKGYSPIMCSPNYAKYVTNTNS